MDPMKTFADAKRENVQRLGASTTARGLARQFMLEVGRLRYVYHFEWLGRPIIQLPQDIVAIQELIWTIKPDFVVETGIAHGGSLVLSASILELIGGTGRVIGV